jgi:DNA polymerase-3 subunit epsilon
MIIFDTETNGLDFNSSVLSISAIKIENNKIIDSFDRYYFPKEGYNQEAISVNGLTEEVIKNNRNNGSYPLYFKSDMWNFYNFIKDETHFVGHNIEFDIQFIKPINIKHYFCTMKTNIDILKLNKPEYKHGAGRVKKPFKFNYIKSQYPRNFKYKYPKLIETAKFYNIDINESEFHGSLYDTIVTHKIFEKMAQFELTQESVNKFLNDSGSKPEYRKFSYKLILK